MTSHKRKNQLHASESGLRRSVHICGVVPNDPTAASSLPDQVRQRR